MKNYRVEVNKFGNAFNVEKKVGGCWPPVIRWLDEPTAMAWVNRLKKEEPRRG